MTARLLSSQCIQFSSSKCILTPVCSLTLSLSCRSLFPSRCLQRCLQFSVWLLAFSDSSEQRSRPLGLRPRYGAGSPASSPCLPAFGPRQGCSWPCGYSERWRQASAPVVHAGRILRYLKTSVTRLLFTVIVQKWNNSDTGCRVHLAAFPLGISVKPETKSWPPFTDATCFTSTSSVPLITWCLGTVTPILYLFCENTLVIYWFRDENFIPICGIKECMAKSLISACCQVFFGLPANRMDGVCNAYRAVVRKCVGHVEGREGNCKDFREKGCESGSSWPLQWLALIWTL